MKRPLAKKKISPRKKSVVKTAASTGKIVEMWRVPEKKHPNHFPALLVMVLVAVAGITMSVLSFRRMSAALVYADSAGNELAVIRSRAEELEARVTDLQTLQALASKDSETPISMPDKTWGSYSSENLSFQYPSGFEVIEPGPLAPALTVKNDKGRIEIFRMNDFGDRPISVMDSQADIDIYVPKESLMVGTALGDSRIQPYEAWLYYSAGDTATRSALQAIAASVKALK